MRWTAVLFAFGLLTACTEWGQSPGDPTPAEQVETRRPWGPRLPARVVVDETFGQSGRVVLDLANREQGLKNVVMSSDGTIVAVGHVALTDVHMAAARFTSDGVLDQSFAERVGVALIGDGAFGQVIALDAEGRILIAGHQYTEDHEQHVLLGRLQPDGKLDPSFGTRGMISIGIDTQTRALFVLPSGDILLVGTQSDESGSQTLLACFDDRGVLEPSFGIDGIAVFDPGPGLEFTTRAVRDSNDGAITFVGYRPRDNSGYVARSSADGQPDPAFAATGVAILDAMPISTVWAVALEPKTRKILVGGQLVSDRSVVVRLNRDGALDPTWGDAGFAVGPDAADQYYALLPQLDGSVLGVGFRGLASDARPLLTEHSPDGRMIGVSLGSHAGDMLVGATMDDQGRVVGVGSTVRSDPTSGLVVRFAPR
jgi:uncharacterized delta-60 repeat protein